MFDIYLWSSNDEIQQKCLCLEGFAVKLAIHCLETFVEKLKASLSGSFCSKVGCSLSGNFCSWFGSFLLHLILIHTRLVICLAFMGCSHCPHRHWRLVHMVQCATEIRKWNVCAISDFCSQCAMVLNALCNVLTLEWHIAIAQNGCGTYSCAMSHTSMHRTHMKLHHVNSIIIIHTTYSMW